VNAIRNCSDQRFEESRSSLHVSTLDQLHESELRSAVEWLRLLFRHDWIVYAKLPFGAGLKTAFHQDSLRFYGNLAALAEPPIFAATRCAISAGTRIGCHL
jgi:hypothetical protein